MLALDTATTTASAALYDRATDTVLAELTWQARRRQTQDLLPATQDLVRLAGVQTAEISALAVTTGPGSFTGVRIGISTVKGIGLGLPQPPQVVGVPTLSVTAWPWLCATAGCDAALPLCAAIQAGRGRYNWVWFGTASPLWRPQAEDHQAGTALEFATAISAASRPLRLVGELGTDLRQAVRDLDQVVVTEEAAGLRRAGWLAALAAHHLAAGNDDTLEALQPLYLRSPA
jgi:tRNA threonylcarbamoyladenosine biosynthesis protein TsaB